jgi:hypothetical protein
MAAAGMTIRAMAAELGYSYTAVRHWLVRYGIKTARATTLADTAQARLDLADETDATCPKHGWTRYRRLKDGFRCLRCRQEAVSERRRAVKQRLVDEAGGCCVLCGYDRSVAALQFHHLDPATKRFALSGKGVTRAMDSARAEAAKCILLCANCHAEVEAGHARLTFAGDLPPWADRHIGPG